MGVNFSFAQYVVNGSAVQNSCNCYTLTPAQNFQVGSVWNANKINLSNSFDFRFNVFLGCADASGADGIVFILQPISTSLGTAGGGMGFEGISPSIGIALDTWQNTGNNDPAFDHISIQSNGNITHGADLAGPIQASATNVNIEDCQWHVIRITWDATTNWLSAFFDDSLRISKQINLVTTIFNNDPLVYWGFTAATGGANNLQQFCTELSANFTTNLSNNPTCVESTITFTDSSTSFTTIQNFYWDFGDGSTSMLQNPPPHFYSTPGNYIVKHVITGLNGCVSDTIFKTITIGAIPVSNFNIFDTCYGKPTRVVEQSTCSFGTITEWFWFLDGIQISTTQQPNLPILTEGNHQLRLVTKSNYGCSSDTATRNFQIKQIPIISIASNNSSCPNQVLNFNGIQVDTNTTIQQWYWNFGDTGNSNTQNTSHSYTNSGNYSVSLWTVASNGCVSDSIKKIIAINSTVAFAGNDTTVYANTTYQLNATGGGTYNWTPTTGLNNPSIANPTSVLQNSIVYILTTTLNGCSDTDAINITVLKGPAIYVPTGFTPNCDNLNDLFLPHYYGIKRLYFLNIYNRWGQLIFTTNNMLIGWNGNFNGVQQPIGIYIWTLKAEDLSGKIYEMKGITNIIR